MPTFQQIAGLTCKLFLSTYLMGRKQFAVVPFARKTTLCQPSTGQQNEMARLIFPGDAVEEVAFKSQPALGTTLFSLIFIKIQCAN